LGLGQSKFNNLKIKIMLPLIAVLAPVAAAAITATCKAIEDYQKRHKK
jgi:hypothetical protein